MAARWRLDAIAAHDARCVEAVVSAASEACPSRDFGRHHYHDGLCVFCGTKIVAPPADTWPDLTRTRAALAAHAAGEAERDRLLWDASTDVQFAAWKDLDEAALRTVQDAYYADTSDRNHPDACRLMDIRSLQRIVKKWEEVGGPGTGTGGGP